LVESEGVFHHRDHTKKVNKGEHNPENLVESEGIFHHRDHTKKVGKGDKPASLSESSTHESLKKKLAHHKKKHQERGNAENVR